MGKQGTKSFARDFLKVMAKRHLWLRRGGHAKCSCMPPVQVLMSHFHMTQFWSYFNPDIIIERKVKNNFA